MMSTCCRDHTATLTALELLHRYYAQYSMVTNDRFLISMACLYLGGKIADSPKRSRDVIMMGVRAVEQIPEVAEAKIYDREWMDGARQQLVKAERALLYQTGFRFERMTVVEAVVHMLQDQPLKGFVDDLDDEKRGWFSTLCVSYANHSAKTPLILQYAVDSIASTCVWMAMKFMKLDTRMLTVPKPWYFMYHVSGKDLEGVYAKFFFMYWCLLLMLNC